MTKQEYEAYIEELKERGYILVCSRYGTRQYYYKVIEYRINKCERITIEFTKWIDKNIKEPDYDD